jgi:hypothetical protein
LTQWRCLEVDITSLVGSTLSPSKSTTTTALSSDDSGQSQDTSVSWSPTSANRTTVFMETSERQRRSYEQQQQQHQQHGVCGRDMRDSGIVVDYDGCSSFLTIVGENAAAGDRHLYEMSANATLVDELMADPNNCLLVITLL